MSDTIFTKSQTYKARASVVAIYNDGPATNQKHVLFRLVACPSSEDGERIGSTKATVERNLTLPEMLERWPAESQAAFGAIQKIGEILCAEAEAELAAQLSDVPEATPEPEIEE